MTRNNSGFTFRETFSLTFLLLTAKIFTNLPLLFTVISGTGAPSSALISGALFCIAILLFSQKFYAHQSDNIITCTQRVFGTPGKYLISLIFLLHLALSSLYTLHELSGFSKLLSFPTAPPWFVAFFFILSAISGALGGIKGLFRISRIIAPIFVAVLLLLLLSVLFGCDYTSLFPLCGNGIDNVLTGGIRGLVMFSDIFLIFLINPSTDSSKTTRRAILSASLTAALAVFLLILTFTAKMPYPLSAEAEFPLYQLMKEVYFGRFFQRIDAIILFVSALCGMLSLAVNICLIVTILKDTFDVKCNTGVVFSTGIIFFSAFLGSVGSFFQYAQRFMPHLAALLFLITVLSVIFRRKEIGCKNEK